MNILHITTYLQGGAGNVIATLAKSQYKDGNKVVVITSESNIDGYCNYEYYIEELQLLGIKVIKIDSLFKRDIFLNMKVINKLREILIEDNINIIHAHAAIPALISIISKTNINKKIPILQTMHGWGLNKKEEHEFVDISIMNLIDKVVTVSKADKSLLEVKGVEPIKIQCVYNGIKSSNDVIKSDDDIDKISEFKKSGYFIIGCIGSIGYRKNQKLLLKAINEIDEKIALVLIGDLEDCEHINKIVENCNKTVLLLGYKRNAVNYMKYFDTLVLPSRSEGLPISIIEAFKEKITVICSDIEGCLEIVEDNVTGFIFKNNDKESLINAIGRRLNVDSSKIITRAYKRYLNEFTEEIMIKEYKNLYSKLMI